MTPAAPTVALHDELADSLKTLRMPTIRTCYQEEAEQARKEGLSYEHYLLELIRRESEVRHHGRIGRLMTQSRLPREKTIDTFERGRLPHKLNQQLGLLLEGHFVDRAENILAFGNPGSGKTHLLAAIGHALVLQGRRVLFRPCSLLVQDLLIAKRDLELARTLKRLSRYDAIIIDDIGYVQQSREEMEVLFTLLADRYETGSVLLSSNLPFSKWERIFKDPMTTAAAIDRLVHHAIILELNLASYRLENSKTKDKELLSTNPSTPKT
jgi:DNA replication protein DnaC